MWRKSRFMVAVVGAMVGMSALLAAEGGGLAALPGHIALDDRLHVSAQPSAEALKSLGAEGVRTVINLRPPAETPDLDEKAVVEAGGVTYRALPIAGAAGLTRANVEAFDQLLAEAKEGKVLMHCASGNRVGAMMALRARWLQGRSAEESLAIGRRSGLTGLAGDVKKLVDAESPPATH